MIFPGSNLLAMAQRAQGAQTVQWFVATGRAPNAVRQLVTAYADPVPVAGSFQPKSKAWAQAQGLDISKDYALFYASRDMRSVQRGETGDKFTYANGSYQAVDNMEWFAQDGWNAIVLVKTGPPNA